MITVEKRKEDGPTIIGEGIDLTPLLTNWNVYIGYEDGVMKGYFIISKRHNPWSEIVYPLLDLPYVAYLYCPNNKPVLKELLLKINAICKRRGAPQFLATNFMGISNDQWIEMFKDAGIAKVSGSVLTFDV
jgi:hypothetical protein